MTFWIGTVPAALVVMLLPYMRIAVKRIRMIITLRALCKKHNRTLVRKDLT